MKGQPIFLVGEPSLLYQKLKLVLHRRGITCVGVGVAEAMERLAAWTAGTVIFCGRLCTDPMLVPFRQRELRLICLAEIPEASEPLPEPGPGELQILHGALYGFSGYSVEAPKTEFRPDNTLVGPALADDVAYWVSEHLDACGLQYLIGPERVTQSAFFHAIETGKAQYEALPAVTLQGCVVMRHTLRQGIRIMQHQKTCVLNLIYEMPSTAVLGRQTIGEIREKLGAAAADCLPAPLRRSLDFLSPIPASGIPYARGAAKAAGLPYREVLEKIAPIRSFQVEEYATRENLIRRTLRLSGQRIQGKRICLVDEAIFTGTTLKIVGTMLRACGAAAVYVLIPSPPCRSQCPYFAIPRRPMLWEMVSRENMADALGVDGVMFQNFDAFKQMLPGNSPTCCACFG